MIAKNSKGFTLIEVMIAVVLLAVISLLIWQSVGGAISSKERAEKREEASRGAAAVLGRIARDLSMAVIYVTPDFLGVTAAGDPLSKSVFTVKNSGDQDALTFDTLSHVRYLKNTKESDLAEVTYFLEPQEGEGGAGLYSLKKREKSPLDATPGEGGTVWTLLDGVKELNFRFYDSLKTEYIDQWDSTSVDNSNRLPRAVEVTLVTQDPIDEENIFRLATVVLLEMAPGPNDF